MSTRKLKVVLTRRLPDAVEIRMRELFDAELNLKDVAMDRAALEAAVQRADVLVPTITDRIDADLINGAGEQLKMIANFGAGVDHIDIDAAVARGIIVTNTPGVLTEDTADLGMSLILAVSRRIVEGAQKVAAGEFEGWTPTWMTGRKLWGKRLGIVGMGRIGQALARRAKAFGMQVHYHTRKPISPRIEGGSGFDVENTVARRPIRRLDPAQVSGNAHEKASPTEVGEADVVNGKGSGFGAALVPFVEQLELVPDAVQHAERHRQAEAQNPGEIPHGMISFRGISRGRGWS